MNHAKEINYSIKKFGHYILSYLILEIIEINKEYLNKNKLIEQLNKYCERNSIKEFKEDLEWASFLAKTREPIDEIIIPKFTPESIIALFSLKNKNGKEEEGMYSFKLINSNCEDFYKQVNKLPEENIQSIYDTLEKIFQKSMITLFNNKEEIDNIDDIQIIYQKFKEKKIKEEINIFEVIKEIHDKISDPPHKGFLIFLIDLFKYLVIYEEKDLSIQKDKKSIEEITRSDLKMISIKEKLVKNEGFSENFSKSSKNDLSLTKLYNDKIKSIQMDDIFFIVNPNWRNNIIPEYKKYPSLLYFLFKNSTCEKKLAAYLSKTDSIKNKDPDKFPTFLLILRIFSNINCISMQMNGSSYIGSLLNKNIINEFKCKKIQEFENSPDINWLGLLMNNDEVNKYFSPKMNYIHQYLENLSNYSYIPEEKNKSNYEKVFKELIESLFKVIFSGKLDELFNEEIPQIDEKSQEIKDILFITNLPKLFLDILNEEQEEEENSLFGLFKKIIKDINNTFSENRNIYNELIKAIQDDTKKEKILRIEKEYIDEKNSRENHYNEILKYKNKYRDTLKKIEDYNLKDYNKMIKELIKEERILIKENKKYFNDSSILYKIKSTSKQNVIIKYKEEIIYQSDKTEDTFYLNENKIETELFDSNNNKIDFIKIKTHSFNQINETFVEGELEKIQKEMGADEKKKEKDIEVSLLINNNNEKSDIIETNNIEKNEKIMQFKEFMNCFEKDLDKSINLLNKGSNDLERIKHIIKDLMKQDKIFEKINFDSPKFEDGRHIAENTYKFSENFQDFKNHLRKKFSELFEFYESWESKKKSLKNSKKAMDKSFSIYKFEKNRPSLINLKIDKTNIKYNINTPFVSLSNSQTLQFGCNQYILDIGPIITSFYSGSKFTYKIISLIDKPLYANLIFNKENLDQISMNLTSCFSIKQKTLPEEFLQIYFTIPQSSEKIIQTLKGHLELSVEDLNVKPILVEFKFNIILIPFEIYFKSYNSSMYWEENKLVLKKSYLMKKKN